MASDLPRTVDAIDATLRDSVLYWKLLQRARNEAVRVGSGAIGEEIKQRRSRPDSADAAPSMASSKLFGAMFPKHLEERGIVLLRNAAPKTNAEDGAAHGEPLPVADIFADGHRGFDAGPDESRRCRRNARQPDSWVIDPALFPYWQLAGQILLQRTRLYRRS